MNEFWRSVLLSGAISLVATGVIALFGIPLAFSMARWKFFGKGLLEALIMLPLVLPPTVVGYGILTVFGRRGFVGGWLWHVWKYSLIFRFEGAVLAAAVVAFPLLYMPAKAGFQGVDRELEDVSKLLGAGRLKMLWHVSLPLARRGILSGLVLAFARALGEFGATLMVYGWQAGRLTLPISIYADYENGELANGAHAVWVLAVMSMLLMIAYNRASRVSKT